MVLDPSPPPLFLICGVIWETSKLKTTCCSTLQHTATHCSTLQLTATHWCLMISWCCFPSTHCITLQDAAAHCNTLQLTATHWCLLTLASFCFVRLERSSFARIYVFIHDVKQHLYCDQTQFVLDAFIYMYCTECIYMSIVYIYIYQIYAYDIIYMYVIIIYVWCHRKFLLTMTMTIVMAQSWEGVLVVCCVSVCVCKCVHVCECVYLSQKRHD